MTIDPRGVPIERLDVSAFKVPTDAPESDGTCARDATIPVVVEATAGGKTGLGHGYADASTATLAREVLAPVVKGRDAMGVPGNRAAMVAAVRNLGRAGVASMAISAVDTALWDLKGRLLGLPLVTLLGAIRDQAPMAHDGFRGGGPNPRIGRGQCEELNRQDAKDGREDADEKEPGSRNSLFLLSVILASWRFNSSVRDRGFGPPPRNPSRAK